MAERFKIQFLKSAFIQLTTSIMEENAMTNQPISKNKKSFYEKLSFWIGIIGTVTTLVLTIWNANTKMEIDKREAELKSLEIMLKERSTGVEESKERVERYKWVFSLFPNLNGGDLQEKNFAINLIRLALTKEEAQQLFSGMQASSDTTIRSIGQKGINAIESEPIFNLVSQMNASTAEVRKHAVAMLIQDYKSSSKAITLTLRLYETDKIDNLSGSGKINGLYYLSATDPEAWNKEQKFAAKDIVDRLQASNPGPQTQKALDTANAFLTSLE